MTSESTNKPGRTNYIKNDFMEMWIEDGILHGVYLPDTIVTLEAAKKCVADRLKTMQGKSYPSLVDVRNVVGEQKEAREYYSSTEGVQNLLAGAFIVKPYVPALLANIYLKINKPIVPAKVFKNREKALKWLEEYKAKG